MPLQPFPITEFKTGLYTYLQPWIRPLDAFEPLINAYIYRGTINKRNGYTQFGNQLADHNPVMGIMQRIDESTGTPSLVVASTTNLYLYNSGSNTFVALTSVSSSVFWQGTATGTITTSTFWPHLTPSSVSITDGTTTITDDGAGNLSSGGIFAAGGTINYTTGSVTLNFTGSTPNTNLSITATLAGAYFTGNITNFFNWTNWQPTDPTTFTNSVSYLYMTNNVDPVTLFDGTSLSRPIFYVNSTFTDYIIRTLDIKVYKNRLLMLRPTLNSTSSNALNQSVYYSALFNPFNFINDVVGNGGQLTAATGDRIISAEFLRDAITIFFSNSTWLFRYTNVDYDPFRFDKINVSKNNNSPYGTLAYDERTTSLGSTGFIACDGTNVQRYDIPIIDYYETNISEQYYGQCFSQRYDNLNQSWLLYVSNGTENPLVGGVAPGSDSALIYNFIENSWATYTFSDPLTCLGLYFNINGATWASTTRAWEDIDAPWNSTGGQKLAPILLGGDTTGHVFYLDNEEAVTDNGTSFDVNLTSTRWNPFIQIGQKTQFGYIDFYYSIASVNPDDPIQLNLTFFVDNSEGPATERTLTLDGPINSSYAMKRIYCNLIGEFIQVNIDPINDSYFQILGMILWAEPSGRLTP